MPDERVKMPGGAPLDDYQRGYLDGMWQYAWWKDGRAYVGTTGTTYKRAVERFLGDGSTVEYVATETTPR